MFGYIALPLRLCAAVCASYQVICYRPRYSIFLLPYFLIGLAMACRGLGSRRAIHLAASAIVCAMAVGSVVQERTPQKRAWRETAEAWPALPAPAFYVVLPARHQQPLSATIWAVAFVTPRAMFSSDWEPCPRVRSSGCRTGPKHSNPWTPRTGIG